MTPLDIFSITRDVISLAYSVYERAQLLKENKRIAKKLHDKLQIIEDRIHACKQAGEPFMQQNVLSDIGNDMKSIQTDLNSILSRRFGKFERVVSATMDTRLLRDAMRSCENCQSRIEACRISIAIHRTMYSDMKQLLQVEKQSSSTLCAVSPKANESLRNIQNAVQNLPSENVLKSKESLAASSATVSESSPSLSQSNIDAEEEYSVAKFAKMPSAVRTLMQEAGRTGAPSTYAVDVVRCVDRLWKGWRLNEKNLQYETKRSGRPILLGQGTNGIVCAATYQISQDGQKPFTYPVAVKEIKVGEEPVSDKCVGEWLREFFLQLSLRSDYILRIFGICWPHDVPLGDGRDSGTRVDEEDVDADGTIRIVMERMTCDLQSAIKKGWVTTQVDKFRILQDVCKALSYLHEINVVHRDLKPQNVLLRVDGGKLVGVAKLADFGCSRRVRDQRQTRTFTTRTSAAGTTLFIPPEVMEKARSQKCSTKKSWDVWAYGVLTCMVFSPSAFPTWTMPDIMNFWKSGELVPRIQELTSGISNEIFGPIAVKCLSEEEQDRPRMSDIEKVLDGRDIENVVQRDNESLTIKHDKVQRDVRWQNVGSDESHAKQMSGRTQILSSTESSPLTVEKREARRAEQLYHEAMEPEAVGTKKMLGYYYEKGIGVDRDMKKAVQLYHEAIEAGDVDAKRMLGTCYMNGAGVDRDVTRAVQLYKEAMEAGNVDAKRMLGYCYEKGICVGRDVKKAVQLYQEATETGNVLAKTMLGTCYRDGIGVDRDVKKAVRLFHEAMEAGNVHAKTMLGTCYRDGIGVDRDIRKTVQLYHEAMEAGDVGAKTMLGYCYEKGIVVDRDVNKAVQLYQEAIEAGDVDAKRMLGYCYEEGIVVDRDEKKAVQFYHEAMEAGNVHAKTMLGTCYMKGTGVDRDEKKAVQFYHEAMEAGNVGAKRMYGYCHERGIVVDRDVKKAVQLYHEAMEVGDVLAKTMLGTCYRDGIGVDRDAKKAVQLYHEAMEAGNVHAKRMLGACYRDGIGIDQDVEKAVQLLNNN